MTHINLDNNEAYVESPGGEVIDRSPCKVVRVGKDSFIISTEKPLVAYNNETIVFKFTVTGE